MFKSIKALSERAKWGLASALTGVGLTILVAFLGGQDKPPSASTQALLALLAILAQLGAAWLFNSEGKAEPTMARRSVSRLLVMGQRASTARQQAELLATKGVPIGDLREGIGLLSVHLSYIEEGYVEAIEDWRQFHSRIVGDVESIVERKSIDDE